MARQITKQLAMKIVRKLIARETAARGGAHEIYVVEEAGVTVALIGIRRGSNQEQGHDHLPRALHISPRQARDLANCPMSREQYIACLREKGVLESD